MCFCLTQLIAINKKWAEQYESMTLYYKEKVRREQTVKYIEVSWVVYLLFLVKLYNYISHVTM